MSEPTVPTPPSPAGGAGDAAAAPAARRVDPPPYPWLDDPAQPFGPVGITTTFVVAAVLGAVGVLGVATGVLGGPDARVARLVVGTAMLVLGAVVARTGTARRAWRGRHPGVDPLEAARAAGADVGSAFGGRSRTSRVGRWVLVVVCALVALVSALAVGRAVSGEASTSAGGLVVLVVLGLGALVVGALAVAAGRRHR